MIEAPEGEGASALIEIEQEVWTMKKWIFRILIFGFLFVCIVFSVYTLIVNWKDFFNWDFPARLLPLLFFWFVLLIPLWIHAVSIRHWQLSTKKISIIVMAITSAGVTIYGFLRSRTNPYSQSWIGYLVFALYFIITIVSAYFNWPGRSKRPKKPLSTATRKSARRKDKVYISIPLMTGTDGDASVAFLNATFQKVNESKKRYPDPDFGFWLIEEIYKEKKILAERRGAFKKKLFCPSCDTELSPELREPKKIEFELEYKDFGPFTMQIIIPSVICPTCNKISGIDLDGSLNNHLNEAIIAAFNSENIKP